MAASPAAVDVVFAAGENDDWTTGRFAQFERQSHPVFGGQLQVEMNQVDNFAPWPRAWRPRPPHRLRAALRAQGLADEVFRVMRHGEIRRL